MGDPSATWDRKSALPSLIVALGKERMRLQGASSISGSGDNLDPLQFFLLLNLVAPDGTSHPRDLTNFISQDPSARSLTKGAMLIQFLSGLNAVIG